jgi:DNA-binding transcriptional MocR family regulator
MMDLLGLKVVQIPTHPRQGVSLEALEYAMDQTPVAACLFIPNFNNPLGSLMPEANKRKLVEMLAARNVPLIEDDIYGDLGHPSAGEVRPSVCKAYDKAGLVLTCSSFSKTLAPGYRVGWCAPGKFRNEVVKLKLYNTLATATLPQMAIAEFLAGGGYEHHLRKVRRTHEAQVRRMTDAVAEHFPPGTKLTRPAGGFLLWVELPESVDAMALHGRALTRGVSIAPGPIFSPKERFRHFVRLNCGLDWTADVDKAIVVLGELVRQMM